jgi:16S rRNA (guanine966-N2)-methyltransferase
MRIIAGEWRSRQIVAPKGDTTRPTADRTRETLFSMLTSRLGSFDELLVLDLFAGSGALGLEALSRGAAHCIFVEQDPAALTALDKNIATLGGHGRCEVRRTSVMSLGHAIRAADLILSDAPYRSRAGEVALDKLARLGWISSATWTCLETAVGEIVEVAGFNVETVRVVGKAQLTLLTPGPNPHIGSG